MTTPLPSTAALRGLVDVLVTTPVDRLTVEQVQQQIVAVSPEVSRLRGWLLVLQSQLHDISGGELPTDDGGRRSVAGWLADVRGETAATCGAQVRTTSRLREVLPRVVDAVLAGVLTPEQAAVLARLIGKIRDADLTDSQDDLVLIAAGRDPVALAAWVRAQIATHCEPALDSQAARGRDRRYLQTRREADGCLRGRFILTAEDSETVLTTLEALARRQGLTDERSAGQRRADALVEACEQVLRHGELPEHGGHRPQLSYVLPADWAAGRTTQATCTACGPACPTHRPPSFADTVTAGLPGQPGVPAEHGCATAAWTGPQTRARIETILCDARISRILLDSLGQVRSLHTLTDTVTPTQRRALAARDLGCTARGCTRPPAMCDAHHLVRRADNGPTTLDNLTLLCRRHHVLWHLGKLGLRDLHTPWHPHNQPDTTPADTWTDRLVTQPAGP